MTDKLTPVRCGCGGEANTRSYVNTFHVTEDGYDHTVYCSKCNIETKMYDTEAGAITAWNRAMGATDTNVGNKERTAKVEAVEKPNVFKCSECGQYFHQTS